MARDGWVGRIRFRNRGRDPDPALSRTAALCCNATHRALGARERLRSLGGNPGRALPVSSQNYGGPDGDVVHPEGYAHRAGFTAEPWPTWQYDFGSGVQLGTRSRRPDNGLPVTLLSWKLAGALATRPAVSTTLCVRLLHSGRDSHALHHENAAFRFDPGAPGPPDRLGRRYAGVTRGRGTLERPIHAGIRPGFATSRTEEELRPRAGFCRGLGIARHLPLRHLPPRGHAVARGRHTGGPTPAARRKPRPSRRICALRNASVGRRSRPACTAPPMRTGAARRPGETIVAGYPWFTDWGRDTFIALRGLCLATGRLDDARDILLEWAGRGLRGHAAEPLPRSGRGARVQLGRRVALVRRRGRTSICARPRTPAAAAARRRDRRAARRGRGDPRRLHRGTRYGIRMRRRRTARRRRAGRAAHVDGREGRRLGRHAAHRQAGRGPGALAERACASAARSPTRWQPAVSTRAARPSRALLERDARLPLRRGRLRSRAGTRRSTPSGRTRSSRSAACRSLVVDGAARAGGRGRGRGTLLDAARAAVARAGRARLRRPLRGRRRGARRRLPPGHGVAVADRAVRRSLGAGARRHAPKPSGRPASDSWHRSWRTWTRPASGTCPRSPTPRHRTPRAAVPSRRGRSANCCACARRSGGSDRVAAAAARRSAGLRPLQRRHALFLRTRASHSARCRTGPHTRNPLFSDRLPKFLATPGAKGDWAGIQSRLRLCRLSS